MKIKAGITSSKNVAIDNANSQMIVALIVASVLSVFALSITRALMSEFSYLGRVHTQKSKVADTLKKNVENANKLVQAYGLFNGSENNIIGGIKGGTGPQDGDNARIVLDALPSKYDFPALATSIEKILLSRQVKVGGIGGVDEETKNNVQSSSPSPTAAPILFNLSGSASYANVRAVIGDFERSIRPFKFNTLQLSVGDGTNMNFTLNGETYFQPTKNLEVTFQEIK